jgi:hypothetical protein
VLESRILSPMNLLMPRCNRFVPTLIAALLVAALVACGGGSGGTSVPVAPTPTPAPASGAAWLGFGGDSQHAAQSQVATQPLSRIVWQTPVDVAPQYSARGYLLVHYGSPVITASNTVIVPVKRDAKEVYRFEARAGSSGELLWSVDSDYAMPTHRWTPSYNVTLTSSNRIYAPGAGGKVYFRDNADSSTAITQTAVFYGASVYAADKAGLDASVIINTPIAADAQGTIFFGFIALPGNAAGLTSGVARIGADGKGTWTGAGGAAGDTDMSKVVMNSAPALSADQRTLYLVVNGDPGGSGRHRGYLLALDSATLAPKARVLLVDPNENVPAYVSDDSTASPTVGPDGDVFIGVLEATGVSHNARGWLLHFNAALTQTKTPGSFGWDDTASVVPTSMVPSYTGTSPYLITTKYNNYGRAGSGDAMNRIAVLDPNASQIDSISGRPVMKEVLTILGPTPDPSFPGGFVEWCINTAAVDPFTRSILVNSEDGYMYRWSLVTNTLSERIRLTSGLGESYTPTAIGPDGRVYAINNGVLFSLGK